MIPSQDPVSSNPSLRSLPGLLHFKIAILNGETFPEARAAQLPPSTCQMVHLGMTRGKKLERVHLSPRVRRVQPYKPSCRGIFATTILNLVLRLSPSHSYQCYLCLRDR